MALNFDAIRRKLDNLSGNTKNRNTMWKPEEGGKYTVRLLSFPDNDGQPFKELAFYYNIPGQRSLLAPSQFGKNDPVQELINKLREEGTKESYEMAKQLYPKMRIYAPVIVRGEEDKGVQLWAFGKLVYQALLSLIMDEEYGDITDPKTGTDITVTITKSPGQQWAKTEVLPKRKSSPLSDNKEEVKNWLTNIPDLLEIYQLKSYEELTTIINNWLEAEPGQASEGTTWRSQDDDEDSSGTYNNLDDAFNDLMK